MFSERLKRLRKSNFPPFTQNDLATAISATQRKISFMENGVTEPSLKDIVAICKYFNVSADYLLGLPDNMEYYHEK